MSAVKKRMGDLKGNETIVYRGYGRVKLMGCKRVDHRGPFSDGKQPGIRFSMMGTDFAAIGWADPDEEVEVVR